MKDLKIEVPEGYEIDKEKSTFERIVFKKKDGRVRSWERLPCSESYLTDKDVSSIEALKKLLMIRQQWINDYDPNWEPVWNSGRGVWCVWRKYCIINVGEFSATYHELSFPTEEMANDFAETFGDLLKVYFNIKQ